MSSEPSLRSEKDEPLIQIRSEQSRATEEICAAVCLHVWVSMCTVFVRVRFTACKCVRLLMYCTYVHLHKCLWFSVCTRVSGPQGRSRGTSVSRKQMVQIETYGSHRVMVDITTTHTNTECTWVGQWGDISWITWSDAYPAVPGGMRSVGSQRTKSWLELTWCFLNYLSLVSTASLILYFALQRHRLLIWRKCLWFADPFTHGIYAAQIYMQPSSHRGEQTGIQIQSR